MSDSPLVAVRSVSKTYRSAVRALLEVSFLVQRGEFAYITGPSGSGKTALLNLIAGLDLPDSGEIIVGGTDVTRLSRAHAAATATHRLVLFSNLTTCSNS
jgi:putative ABC transport system ATP-binding protein